MRRRKILLTDIAAWPNLYLAMWKAAKGKRQRSNVAELIASADQRLGRLQADILAERVPYGEYRSFTIHDPKQRLIHAASFPDRILHLSLLLH